MIRQYIARINLSIALLVYARGLVTLQAAVDITKSIEAGFKITQKNGARFNFISQQPAENRMEVMVAMLKKILLKRKKERFSRSNPRGSRNFTCWKCEKPGHILITCESEKVLPTWRLSRNYSLARNNQRWAGNLQRSRVSNYTERESIRYITEDPDSRDVII